MPVDIDIADDLARIDRLETVTLFAPDADTGVTVAGALRRRPTRREQEASDGRYLADDVRWHLPAASLSTPPLPGARIIDAAGERWTVLEVERAALGTRYACLCRNLAISGGLDQTVTLQRATWTKDAAGAPVATWRDVRVGLRARLQPIDGAAEVARDQPTTKRRYRVYLEERLSIDQDCRIIHDGRAYRVTGYEMPERIDRLLVVLVEAE
jgi:SPP1 family predicted phage head-tail adaptor